jgi:hypothetical protein
MGTIRDLLHHRHSNVINHGGEFAFTIPYTPELVKQIEEMGEDFKSKYQFTVASIPGMPGNKIICINLKAR